MVENNFLCSEPDDGIDPRKASHFKKKVGRKTYQLCKQIMKTLNYAFCESEDDVVRNLSVLEVKPAPDESRLLVIVGCMENVCEPGEVEDHLQKESAKLRMEVAADIHRKKVPELVFQFIGNYV